MLFFLYHIECTRKCKASFSKATKMKDWTEFSFVDLFCGGGGISLGFEQSGFKSVGAIDIDESAVKTYRLNSQNHVVREEITENTELVPSDVIIGGPPCQGFSSAGMRRSDDKRNSLVRVFSELVARHRPKAFVFENVEGFLTAGKGERVFDLLTPLIMAGYRIHLRKVNAANYGVPQHRKRVIAIGGLGWDPTFPEPTHGAFGAPGASSVLRNLPRCPALRAVLEGFPPPTERPPGFPQGHYTRELSETDRKRIALLKPGQSMKHLPAELWHESFRRRAFRRVKDGTPTDRRGGAPFGLRRLNADQPSKAITSGAISEFVHPFEDRFMTLRECARIQTFPDDYHFAGTPTQHIIQVGNAVPPRLAGAVAQALRIDLQVNEAVSESKEGALLSFVPTASSGMSPALQNVYEAITGQFCAEKAATIEQLPLWP